MSENQLTESQAVQVEALRLAILNKEKNGSRFTLHSVAAAFADFIRTGKEFRID